MANAPNGRIKAELSSTGNVEGVADAFVERILNGANPPGSRLTERQIVEVGHCSHSRAREVLHLLEKAGAVRILRHRGAVVFGPDDARATEVDLVWTRLSSMLETQAGEPLRPAPARNAVKTYEITCSEIERLGEKAGDRRLADLLKRIALHKAILSRVAA